MKGVFSSIERGLIRGDEELYCYSISTRATNSPSDNICRGNRGITIISALGEVTPFVNSKTTCSKNKTNSSKTHNQNGFKL